MKRIILFFLFVANVSAWDASVEFSSELENNLIINCNPQEIMCMRLCFNPHTCKLKSSDCVDCIGPNNFLSHFYREVGRMFVSSGVEVKSTKVQSLFQKNRLIYLTPDGPYNIYSPLGDMRIERYFNSLCPSNLLPMPIVMGVLDESGRIKSTSHVICHNDEGSASIFSLLHSGQLAE